MLPILFSLGPVKIYSYGVMFAIGLFISLYFWWKMGRDEHFDEIVLFDGFFLSVLTYLISGRIGYVLGHMAEVGTIYRTLAILAYPGINVMAGVFCVSIFVILFARAQDWNVWKVLDAYVVALSLVLFFGAIGGILNGSDPVWQINVFGAVWAFVVFLVVSKVRKNFRFYAWYKGESSMAQDGLASLIFAIAIGMYYVTLGFIHKFYLESVLGSVFVIVNAILINRRIGRRENTLWGKLSNIIRRK